MRFVLSIPYAYPCYSAIVSSQKKLCLRGKENFRITKYDNGKVCTWRRESYVYFFFQSRKNQF